MSNSIERGLKRLSVSPDMFSTQSVLDVGSGTGFWVEFWLAKGVRQIVGIDLTAKSISSLAQKHPQLKFQQMDIADRIDTSMLCAFDIVSAMSVLNHIPSQPRWEQALANLGYVLKPGGYLLLMDPILKYRWWGKPFDHHSSGFPRTISAHVSVLAKTGVKMQFVLPTVAILANPVDTKSKLEFLLLERWWSLFSRVANQEQATKRICWFMYVLDRLLCRLNYMPSSKIIFCRKEPSNV
jgi:SAM-dependent methyltransferase